MKKLSLITIAQLEKQREKLIQALDATDKMIVILKKSFGVEQKQITLSEAIQ